MSKNISTQSGISRNCRNLWRMTTISKSHHNAVILYKCCFTYHIKLPWSISLWFLSFIFWVGIFWTGIFCTGIFCTGIFCMGIFCTGKFWTGAFSRPWWSSFNSLHFPILLPNTVSCWEFNLGRSEWVSEQGVPCLRLSVVCVELCRHQEHQNMQQQGYQS